MFVRQNLSVTCPLWFPYRTLWFLIRSLDYPYPWTHDPTPTAIVTCIAETDGAICWDTSGSHGFKIGHDIAVFW